MKQLVLILMIPLLALAQTSSKYVLIIGNSRATAGYYFPSDSITKYLGYAKFKNMAISGTTTPQIYSTLQNNIDSCGGEDSIGAVVFMDATNDIGLNVTPSISYKKCEAICERVLQIVTPNKFYWFQSAPNKNAFGANDSAVITTSANNGSRSKALALWAREYILATKYHMKFVPVYSYFVNDNPDSSDYPEAGLYLDGTHFTQAAYTLVTDALKKATIFTDMKIMWGGQNQYEGNWRGWYRPSVTSVIVGDTGTGSISMATGDTVFSPIKGLGWKIKTVSVDPYLASGSVKILVRYSDSYFKVNRSASSLQWLSYDSNTTEKNYCQFAVVAESNTVMDSCLYKWTNESLHRSNYKKFGNRLDMVRDWHKDNFLMSGNTRSYGGTNIMECYTNWFGYCTVLRFGTDYDIPSNAIIDSAKINIYNYKLTSSSTTVGFYKMLCDFGETREWDENEENQTSSPTRGQATYYKAHAPNVKWLSGDSIGINDYSQKLLDSPLVKVANCPIETKITSDVTRLVRNCIADTSKYYGWLMRGIEGTPTNTDVIFYTQNADGSESAYRPYLEVWYTTHTAPTFTLHPENDTAADGGTLSFSAVATGNGTITYKWYILSDSVGAGNTISLKADYYHNGKDIYCIATDDSGSTTSISATISVNMTKPTKYYIDAVVNHDSVSEASTSFLHKLNLYSFIDSIDKYIDSSNDVVVMNKKGDTIIPRSSFYVAGKKLLLDFTGAKDTLTNNTYRICFDTALSAIRSDTVYSTAYSGFRGYWGFNSNVRDYIGTRNGTLNSPAAVSDSGLILNGASGSVSVSAGVVDTGNITVDFDVILLGYGESNTGRIIDNGNFFVWISPYAIHTTNNSGTTVAVCSTVVATGEWTHITISRTSSGTVTAYKNGTKISQKSGGTPTYASATTYIGNRAADDRTFNGIIKNFAVYSNVKSDAFAVDRYKSMYEQGTFYSLTGYNYKSKSIGNSKTSVGLDLSL